MKNIQKGRIHDEKKVINVHRNIFFSDTIISCMWDKKRQVVQTSSDEGEQKEVLRVGMEAGYPPFNWTQLGDANGGVKIEGNTEYAGGYDVEIAKKIAEGLGKELVIVKTEWDGLVPSLQSGKIDVITAGMSPTEERKAIH